MRQLTLPCLLAALIASLSACSLQPSHHAIADTAEDEPIDGWSNNAASSSKGITLLDHWTPEQSAPRYDNIWDRILDNYRMDLAVENDRITSQRNWYVSNSAYLERVSTRSAPYIYYIAEQIEARQIPGELALLPIVESAFDPFAYSHGRASGVWQFIPSTGTYFGLRQDWWYDGRRDVRAATNAALDYLTALARQFDNDWLLALASYNAGSGNVSRAIKRNQAEGKPTDFWSLELPKETQAYVPKLLALAQILRDQEKYNARFTPIPDQPYFAVVETGGQIDLSQIADLSDTDIDEVYRLNPGFNRWATSPDGPHQILVPKTRGDALRAGLLKLPPESRMKWNQYKVKSGDNLASISRQFNTTVDLVRQANNLSNNMIRVGQVLMIPGPQKEGSNYSLSANERQTRNQTVRKPANSNRHNHQVKSGDTLWSLASAYNVTVREIARWNSMAPGDPLSVGQKLTIWIPDDKTPPKRSGREEIRKINYSVRGGDSLASIAGRFKVAVTDIRKWNPTTTKAKYLYPGQKLTLYVNVVR